MVPPRFAHELRRICEEVGVALPVVLSRRRTYLVVCARKLAARYLRLYGLPYTEIGRILERDHTTILVTYFHCDGCGAEIQPKPDPDQACARCGLMYWSPARPAIHELLIAVRSA